MHSGNLNERPEPIASAVRRNIEMIARLEQEFMDRRTAGDRITDGIAAFAGSLRFVALHATFFGTWIAVNLGAVPGVEPYDPYPFLLLGMIVSMEAIFLATFVLMKQNRMSKRADQRANLDLQINMLAEREMTLVLQMLQRMSTRLGVRLSGEEIEELSEETPIEALASELRDRLPGE